LTIFAQYLKLKGLRSTTEGHLTDVTATFKRVAGEVRLLSFMLDYLINFSPQLSNLHQRCKVSAMCIIVRTDGSQKNVPLYFADSNMADAMETITGFTLDDLGLKTEAYSLFHLKGMGFSLTGIHNLTDTHTGVAKNENNRKTLTKARVGTIIRKGLCK
jgi:methionine salvage enolase-phosphatase E1